MSYFCSVWWHRQCPFTTVYILILMVMGITLCIYFKLLKYGIEMYIYDFSWIASIAGHLDSSYLAGIHEIYIY